MRRIRVGVFCVFFTSCVTLLEAAQIPSGQDVGATTRFEKSEKEHAAMMKNISRRKAKVEIKGQAAVQQEKSSDQ